MSQVTNYAYNKIQNFLASNVTYLELQDESGTPIKRFSTLNGLTINNDTSNQTITYEVTVSGDNNFLNKTVSQSILYDVANGGEPIAIESFIPFTFESEEDELTIRHKIQVPQL